LNTGDYVLVRTYSAGVHYGNLSKREGKEVTLTHARRIHYWMGAFTLSKIATTGVGDGSRISCEVPEILLTEAIEIIPITENAADKLRNYPEHAID
jgi:hypothetical protein